MICVIADDLTGAAELGSIGLRCGLAAELFVRPRRLNPEVPTGLVCVDTDSRSSGSSEAAARASQACGVVSSTQPAWIYKKVDSVLRGNVVAEIAAIMQELGFRRALLAPANPSFGRIIRDGRYYVNGKPISETHFAHD